MPVRIADRVAGLAQEASRVAGFPANLRGWHDDHRVAWRFTMGMNLSGNLVFGDASLQRELDLRAQPPTPAESKLQAYVAVVSQRQGAAYGSSAGGEQPKFLWLTQDAGPVVVKFARLGSRMAELLALEHPALRSLRAVGIPASRSELPSYGDHVLLEVRRFDRVGPHGRIGLLSAGVVDDEAFGRRDSWPEFAARCEQAGYLSAEDALRRRHGRLQRAHRQQ